MLGVGVGDAVMLPVEDELDVGEAVREAVNEADWEAVTLPVLEPDEVPDSVLDSVEELDIVTEEVSDIEGVPEIDVV